MEVPFSAFSETLKEIPVSRQPIAKAALSQLLRSWGRYIGVAEMEQVKVLFSDERVQLDLLRIEELERLLGERDAEYVIVKAMEEVAIRLTLSERAFAKQDWKSLTKTVKSAQAIGEQIGMQSLTLACRNTIDAIAGGNPPAVAATFFRLQRVGDRSLSDYWDLQGVTG